jgi:hypothetical protein
MMAVSTTVSAGGTEAIRASRRVEKTCSGNALHGERRDPESDDVERRIAMHERRLSRNETAKPDPDWNAPWLRAAFVAQVLGQVLGATSCDRGSALAAYGKPAAIPSLFLNARA